MRPQNPGCKEPQGELYRTELVNLINLEHPLARLARSVKWERFDGAFTPLYDPGNGRPAIATRLMVGLHYLKHLYQLSDEDVVEQWVENPYWQYLCGSKYFEHALPIHPTSMTRWRKKIEAAGAEQMLAETIAASRIKFTVFMHRTHSASPKASCASPTSSATRWGWSRRQNISLCWARWLLRSGRLMGTR
jgi:transposase, IS5 family